jgi:hypothetical protein
MIIKKNYFEKIDYKFFILLLLLLLSIFLANFSLWYDISNLYNIFLRLLDGQVYFVDFYCHFVAWPLYIFVPLLKFFNLKIFIVFISVLTNLLFSYFFIYNFNKISNLKFSRFSFFICTFFFSIPFGLGVVHLNELSLFLFLIGVTYFLLDIKKISWISIFLILNSFLIKYSIAIFLFLSFSISLILFILFSKSKNRNVYIKVSFYYVCIYLISFLIFIFCLSYISGLSIRSIFNYFLFDIWPQLQKRNSFNLYNTPFINQVHHFITTGGLGSFLQLIFFLTYFAFIFDLFRKLLRQFELKDLFSLFIVFAAFFYYIELGRDWNHKFFFFGIIFYLYFYNKLKIFKWRKEYKINYVTFLFLFFLCIVPLNERFRFMSFIGNKNISYKDSFFQSSSIKGSEINIMLWRSQYFTNYGMTDIKKQLQDVELFLSKIKQKKLFFVDETSSIYSYLLNLAPQDPSCSNGDLFTPPRDSDIKRKWLDIYFSKFAKDENSLLVLCKFEDKFCTQGNVFSNVSKKFVTSPMSFENYNEKELLNFINNLNLIFKTKNFYVYSNYKK